MSTHPSDWHLDESLASAYAGGRLDFAAEASVEAHLLSCGRCRCRLAPAVDTRRLDAVWTEVVATIDTPPPGLVERLLLRLGVNDATARLVVSAPSLRLPWIGGIILSLLFAVLAGATSGERGLLAFLTLAPMLPAAGVAVAYGPQTDPAYELQMAAPYSAVRLLLLRTAAVLVTTLPLAGIAGLLLPGAGWLAAAWLLPALALTALSLCLGTYADPLWSAAGVGVAWVTLVGLCFAATRDPLTTFGPVGQATSLLVVLAAVAVFLGRRQHLLISGRTA